MTTAPIKPDDKKANEVKPASEPSKELKTESPLSEKDEVKKAEQKTNKEVKKNA